jgi:filamentous hemagglutinin family protein
VKLNGTAVVFAELGSATISATSNTMTVNQTGNSALLNWARFNISPDGTVNFVQPSATSTAINRVHSQTDPSRILGNLNANGRVYILNRNGVLFGDGAKVNVAGLVASSLDITQAAVDNGIAGAALQGGQAAFDTFEDADGNPWPAGTVRVERGATITTGEGGQVLMFAPEQIVNEGTIKTPGGQTLLAAGTPVYLLTSTNENLRGLLVEVKVGGTVTNGNAQANSGVQDPTKLVGQIVAERGNVTLAGLAVNQEGRVSATTTVREGGSIRLQARDGGSVLVAGGSSSQLVATNGGTLTLAQDSVTDVLLSTDSSDTTVDANDQPRSQIELQGRNVFVLEDAAVGAKGGNISISARATPAGTPLVGATNDYSRVYVASGAVLDVSGAEVELAMERNVVRAELRGDELADSPVQRDGPLRGRAVFVDIRESGTRADGTTWQGTPLADVSGQISLVKRDAAERNLNGGTVSIESQGDVILAQGSTIDLSGGSIRYRDGYIDTTQLLGTDGKVYDVGNADPNRSYVSTLSGYTIKHDRWGVSQTYSGFGGNGRFEPGYVEGKDAGTLELLAPRAILDGNIVANVTAGRYQRNAPGLIPEASLYRPYDELPLGGQLIMGADESGNPDHVVDSVLFGSGLILPALAGENGSAFDPLDPADEPDELPDPLDPEAPDPDNSLPRQFTTTLRRELFVANGITRAEINANGSAKLPEDVALQLPAHGELSILASQVDIAGRIEVPSGRIDMNAVETIKSQMEGLDVELDLRGSAVLDVSGQWVNDSVRLNAPDAQLAPLSIDGGEVSLKANQGSMRLHEGSVIDTSGGAWLRRDESVTAGDAGSITLSVDRGNPVQTPAVEFQMGARLMAYGVEDGGSLSIAAPEICVTAGPGCSTAEDAIGGVTLRPEDLMAGGFADITLRSTERGLTVASGTNFDLQQRNFLLDAAALNAATGTSLKDISSLAVLPDHLRAAADLTLRTSLADLPDVGYSNDNFAGAPGLAIEQGAVISTDPGAKVALQSNSTLLVDGTIVAPAGSISLTLDNSLFIDETLDAQGIWLGSQARLDVSGTTRLQPSPLGLRTGEVLDGGTVTFAAQRGSVIANQGSVIDVSGTSSVLDIGNASGSVLATQPKLIASDGGLLSISAANTVLMSGEVHAQAGSGSSSAAGGELRVTLDGNQQKSGELTLRAREQRVIVSQQSTPVSIAGGTAVPEAFAGQARVAADDIEAAGFDSVVLTARTHEGQDLANSSEIAPGVIEFDGDVNLAVGRQLRLDTAHITGNGDVTVAAPYVALGNSDTRYQDVPGLAPRDADAAANGFSVTGSFVEVIGRSVIDGFSSVQLGSTGDLRLRGVQPVRVSRVEGGLSTNADLTLRADQIYASTLSNFDISLAGNAEGVLRIESTGESRATVLSAGSHLKLDAPTIEQAGVLRAPFGTIELKADDLRLEAGSLTSTSAEGAVIPFGTIQAGDDWVYGLDGETLVAGTTLMVPQQTVSLDGKQVQIDSGAVIDVSGGGDLLAYEFVPGTTGNRDVLSASEAPGRFAIVPALNLQYAPHDPQASTGSSLAVGDTIHISGAVNGLPEGDYVLLPARYALLEGAFVVEAVDGYTDLKAGAVLPQMNGSSIVSGYRTVAGTQFADARSSGFAITSAEILAKEAKYDTALASGFFPAQAAENGTAAPRLPQDAGILAITAQAQLDIDGSLQAVATDTGRGAAVDISAANLRISDTAVAEEGEVVVSAARLSGLGAESLLLGGRRSSTDEGTAIAVAAQNVTVDVGTSLSAPEILLAATDTVRVGENATLTAGGEVRGTDTYLVAGDGATLRLAAGEQAEIRRSNESGANGTLMLEAGARLNAAGGALALDASLDTQSAATLALPGGSLSLGASRINLGSVPADTAGFELDDVQLSGLNLDELVLVSRSTIDLYGDVALSVNKVSLDTAGVRGMTQGDGSITAAGSLLLTNRANREAADAAATSATLQVNADRITVGKGEQRMSGYATVTLNAADELRGEDTGGLSAAGNLNLVTPAVVVASAANTTFKSDSALQAGAGASGVAGVRGAELGGALTLAADSVNVATRLEAAAGSVSLAATDGPVTLSNGAVIDVAGRERNFDGVAVAAPAGDVNLSAANGNVVTQAGSLIDVSGAGTGEAGSISIEATAGTVDLGGQLAGTARAAADSGRFEADAQNIENFAALNTTLNAGGFIAEREFRQRAGDLTVAGGDSIRAQNVSLTADQGNVNVNGEIDARGTDGGDVVLSARDAIEVNGRILASAESADGDGGDVALRAETGLVLSSTALIDVSAGAAAGTTGGDVDMRVGRGALAPADDGSIDAVVLAAGAIEGADQVTLEAFERYSDTELGLVDGVIESANTVADNRDLFDENGQPDDSNLLYKDTFAFMQSSDAIVAALGRSEDAGFRLVAGIEIQSAGDLSLGVVTGDPETTKVVNWDLSQWKFNGAPGVLTLRAGGNLTINGSLSDGFEGASGDPNRNTGKAYRLDVENPADSWSYRLVAGADSASADVMSVDAAVATAGVTGSFIIEAASGAGNAPYKMVRTGNGSIDVAAANDFILRSQNSVIYTAGVASETGLRLGLGNQLLGDRAYPVDGGDISIDVRGDIEGAQTDQLVTAWLWRVGKSEQPDDPSPRTSTAWTVNFGRFQQNVGALGGGDVDISAGGAIRNFSASIPSIGRQVGGIAAADSAVDVIGGGDLTVRAGGNIEGGSYYVGLGTGELRSGSSVTTAYSVAGNADLYPVLALGDGRWDVAARGSAGIETIVNPTLLPQGKLQAGTAPDQIGSSFFSTYADTSAASIRAVAGDVRFGNNTDSLASSLAGSMNLTTENQVTLQLYAPTLEAAALSGDLVLNGDTTLFPGAGGTVELFADDDITRGISTSVRLRQSDADPAFLPNVETPQSSLETFGLQLQQHALTPVHAGDDSLARIVARTGDVALGSGDPTDESSVLAFATPARVVAAGDIVDLPLTVQHDGPNDVSSLVAGGDIRYGITRGSAGNIADNARGINVDGPGTLQLAAGGDVDLQTSKGISTRGNLVNTHLPDGGANVSVLAGVLESALAYDAAIDRYLVPGTGHETRLIEYIEAITGEDKLTQEEAESRFEQLGVYRDDLMAYVAGKSGRDGLTYDGALALFRGYSRADQRVLLERVLFSELRFSGRAAALSGSSDFRRGFTALETMFPGANPDTEAGETNPYAGDIALYFSRIYTLDGGDISLLAPGGEINVGLAAPPAALGLQKGPEMLGLVAQSTGSISTLAYRDFAVNESRVFAADGGDILVWSTDGDIDAGRGAKTAISAPPPVITFDPQTGAPIVTFPPALTGSGIQTLATTEGTEPGNVDLFAPRGVVNAGDAGIVAGNLTIAATAVLGADNIQVSGVAVGVPVDTGGLGASLAGVSAAASSATSAATTSVDGGRNQEEQQTSLADTALSWLDVFVVGLGEDTCKQDDIECLKRQKTD